MKRKHDNNNDTVSKRLKKFPIVHQFWHDVDRPPVSKIELPVDRLNSTLSILQQGYQVWFWSYQKIGNFPIKSQLVQKNAADIFPLEEFKKYKPHTVHVCSVSKSEPHISQFANYFGMMVIYEHGGWWIDNDMYCLSPLPVPVKSDRGIIFALSP